MQQLKTLDELLADEARDNLLRSDKATVIVALDFALNEACRIIQNYLGVRTGDFAGHYFSGPLPELVLNKDTLLTYLQAQRRDAQRDPDYVQPPAPDADFRA